MFPRPIFKNFVRILRTRKLLCREKKLHEILIGCEIWRVPSRQYSTRKYSTNNQNVVQRIRDTWRDLFGKHLLLTNTISSGVLMAFGDLVAQMVYDHNRKDHINRPVDYTRVGRMFLVGILMGPLHHYVYGWMDKFMPEVSLRNTVKKILIDQFVMSPSCILMLFYASSYFESKPVAEVNKEIVSKFLYIYLSDWMFWPAAQFINFQYLSTKYRVTFVNICTALYNIFLSYMKHDFHKDE